MAMYWRGRNCSFTRGLLGSEGTQGHIVEGDGISNSFPGNWPFVSLLLVWLLGGAKAMEWNSWSL